MEHSQVELTLNLETNQSIKSFQKSRSIASRFPLLHNIVWGWKCTWFGLKWPHRKNYQPAVRRETSQKYAYFVLSSPWLDIMLFNLSGWGQCSWFLAENMITHIACQRLKSHCLDNINLVSLRKNEQGEPTASYRWIGWSSRPQHDYPSFLRTLWNIHQLNEEIPKHHNR